jgi:hypothetical protein
VREALEMHQKLWWEIFKEKDNLENLGVDTKSAGVWLRIKTSGGLLRTWQ